MTTKLCLVCGPKSPTQRQVPFPRSIARARTTPKPSAPVPPQALLETPRSIRPRRHHSFTDLDGLGTRGIHYRHHLPPRDARLGMRPGCGKIIICRAARWNLNQGLQTDRRRSVNTSRWASYPHFFRRDRPSHRRETTRKAKRRTASASPTRMHETKQHRKIRTHIRRARMGQGLSVQQKWQRRHLEDSKARVLPLQQHT